MWNEGAGEIIEQRTPAAVGQLKDIMDMAVPGGHDAPATSETDLRNSIDFIRGLWGTLRVGG